MPLRNSAKFICDALDSIINQSYSNWELIIVDDHSVDDSIGLIEKYQKLHSQIFWFNNPGKGIIPALKFGFSKAQGKFICRFDSDDKMPKDRLKIMLNKWNESSQNKTIVTGQVEYFGKTISEGYKNYEKWLNQINSDGEQWSNIYRECVIASPNWLMRKQDLLAIGAFNNLEYPEDYDLVLKCYQAGFQIQYCEETTLYWREHPERTSRNSEHYQQRAFFQLKISQFLKFENKGQKILIWGSTKKGRLSASILLEKGYDFIWMDLNPQQFPNGIQGQKVISFLETSAFNPLETQILLCIYPENDQKRKIKAYLESLNFLEGKNYWYL